MNSGQALPDGCFIRVVWHFGTAQRLKAFSGQGLELPVFGCLLRRRGGLFYSNDTVEF